MDSSDSTVIRKIDDKLANIPPDSLRAKVLIALRRFRAGWIDLGRMLNEIAFGGDYREWGYEDFEVYCAKELGLKKPTVQKLMVSYNYMRVNEESRLRAYEDATPSNPAPAIPDYQTVELLSKVSHTDEINEEERNQWREEVFSDEGVGDVGETNIRKRLRERLKHPASVPWEEESNVGSKKSKEEKELADILRLSGELRKKLMVSTVVPADLRDALDPLLTALEALR